MVSPSRQMLLAAAVMAVVCGAATTYGADAQSLYQQAISMQSKEGEIDLKAAQDLFEKAAAAGSAMAMQRLGDMYHDGDGGVAKDYAKAMEWYQKEAELDDSHPGTGTLGMYALGEMYAQGRGAPQDLNKANEWFQKAITSGRIGAAKGDNNAMIGLALCLAQGRGTEDNKPNPVEAWSWAIKSSQTPNPWAYELMASLYHGGIGVTRDESAALNNMLKAAQMGVSNDMLGISVCYASGIGVKKDEAIALKWVKRAVERGNARAMAELGRFYHEGIGLERSDTTAHDWYEKAVAQGDESALGYMGDLLIAPGVEPRDALTAVTWYERGAKVGDAHSMYQLANLLCYDPAVKQDIPRAVELLIQSSNLGNSDATAGMGELYVRGMLSPASIGVPSEPTNADLNNALTWFRKAADTGSAKGMRDLGELLTRKADGKNPYDTDDDDKKGMAEAFGWLQKAAALNDVEAIVDVGDAYLHGKGPNESASTAIGWYQRAADAGNIRAIRNLGTIYKDSRVLADYAQAKKWFERGSGISAEPGIREIRNATGDPACMSGLAELYDNGMGVDENDPIAYELYMRAAQLGDAGGFRGIGQYLQQDKLLPQNLPQAAAYFDQAAQRGDIRAMEALGRMFELGQGVEKDMVKATALFKRASDMGSLSAWNWVFSHTAITTKPAVTVVKPGDPGAATRPVAPPVLELIAPVPSTKPATEPSAIPVYDSLNPLGLPPGSTVGTVNNPGGRGGPGGGPGGVTRGGGPGGGGPGGGGPGGGGPGGGGPGGGGRGGRGG
jgi:TPR repeat protein